MWMSVVWSQTNNRQHSPMLVQWVASCCRFFPGLTWMDRAACNSTFYILNFPVLIQGGLELCFTPLADGRSNLYLFHVSLSILLVNSFKFPSKLCCPNILTILTPNYWRQILKPSEWKLDLPYYQQSPPNSRWAYSPYVHTKIRRQAIEEYIKNYYFWFCLQLSVASGLEIVMVCCVL